MRPTLNTASANGTGGAERGAGLIRRGVDGGTHTTTAGSKRHRDPHGVAAGGATTPPKMRRRDVVGVAFQRGGDVEQLVRLVERGEVGAAPLGQRRDQARHPGRLR